MPIGIVIAGIIALSLVETAGDSLIKYSGSDSNKYVLFAWLLLGVGLYILAAFGWFFVMKHVKLGSLGIVYSLSTITFLFIFGTLFFEESYTKTELVGIVLGIVSLILLARTL